MNETPTSSISDLLRQQLTSLAKQDLTEGIKKKFASNPERVAQASFDIDGLHIDFSKTHLSQTLCSIYKQFADEIGFEQKRHALFSGVRINTSEDRSVLHTLLRDKDNQNIEMATPNALEQARDSRQQFASQYAQIQAQLDKREEPVTDIIHVGIGGSSLGTQLVFEALTDLGSEREVHFIGNIDAHQLVAVLDKCRADSTLVIGVSKTFTTAETL